MLSRLEIHITGRVQGVRFRAAAKKKADSLQLTGYVKNTDRGHVELVAEGEKDNLTLLMTWCLDGPILAKVASVNATWAKHTNEYTDFSLIRSNKGFIVDQIKALSNLGKSYLELPKDTIVPGHIAIIPDGNRRWAKERGLFTIEGHKRGFENLVQLSRAARKLGVRYLTIWAFSTENWNRAEEEVSYLMKLAGALKSYEKDLHQDRVRFRHLGRKDRLPTQVLDLITRFEEATKDYDSYFLNVAFDYGGQDEILRAIKKANDNGINISEMTSEQFSLLLDTGECPEPDLIIRTSGEQRLSGLMAWQSVYAELFFSPVHFPDFDEFRLQDAILEFSRRNRRFGK
jgi:undecaprenyl diphosphate synthase